MSYTEETIVGHYVNTTVEHYGNVFVHKGGKLENRQFLAKMHQIAPNCVSNFKIFPGVIPPDSHPWEGDTPSTDPSPQGAGASFFWVHQGLKSLNPALIIRSTGYRYKIQFSHSLIIFASHVGWLIPIKYLFQSKSQVDLLNQQKHITCGLNIPISKYMYRWSVGINTFCICTYWHTRCSFIFRYFWMIKVHVWNGTRVQWFTDHTFWCWQNIHWDITWTTHDKVYFCQLGNWTCSLYENNHHIKYLQYTIPVGWVKYSNRHIKITSEPIIKQHWPDCDGKHTIGVLSMPTVGERGSAMASCGAKTEIGVRSMPSVGDRGSSSWGKKFLDAADIGGGDENWDWSSPASSNPNSCLLMKPPIWVVQQLISPVNLKQLPVTNACNTNSIMQ